MRAISTKSDQHRGNRPHGGLLHGFVRESSLSLSLLRSTSTTLDELPYRVRPPIFVGTAGGMFLAKLGRGAVSVCLLARRPQRCDAGRPSKRRPMRTRQDAERA